LIGALIREGLKPGDSDPLITDVWPSADDAAAEILCRYEEKTRQDNQQGGALWFTPSGPPAVSESAAFPVARTGLRPTTPSIASMVEQADAEIEWASPPTVDTSGRLEMVTANVRNTHYDLRWILIGVLLSWLFMLLLEIGRSIYEWYYNNKYDIISICSAGVCHFNRPPYWKSAP
jgi:hypothetical protein